VKRNTAKDRFSRTLHRFSKWCRENRHLPIREQHLALSRKLRGHYAYLGITGNSRALAVLRYWVIQTWWKWLGRRSWKARLNWAGMARLLKLFPLPPARAVHSVLRAANP
jgi:RNA-directed DNA polymerase